MADEPADSARKPLGPEAGILQQVTLTIPQGQTRSSSQGLRSSKIAGLHWRKLRGLANDL
jgi:hypothetical protein